MENLGQTVDKNRQECYHFRITVCVSFFAKMCGEALFIKFVGGIMKSSKAKMMTGASIVIETLIEQGVTDVFGYPGANVLSIYDELYRAGDKINHVLCAHEQGASHGADGYARATGKVGVVISTSGPGATNLVTGIATAMLDSVPMVAITGNVPTYLIGKDSFQEINITGITMPITKHNYFVTDVNELADTLREAFAVAISGRPGPVLVDIPKDIQLDSCLYYASAPAVPFPEKKASETDIEKAVSLINKSRRPYIYVGGGAVNAGLSEAVIALAEKIDACIGCSFMGLSAFPHSYNRFLGMQGMHGRFASNAANKDADLIIGVGVRFSDRATGSRDEYGKEASIIHLDCDISEINKNVRADIGIVGDIKDSFCRILEKCEKKNHPAWQKKIKSFKTEEARILHGIDEKESATVNPKRIIDIINRYKGDDTVIATDVGQHQMWTAQYAAFEKPRKLVSSGGLGTMGYGMGAAIGASVGCGDRVVLITGDGSFAMNLNELATAVTYNIPLVIVLMNNKALGMVKQWQSVFFEGRYSSTLLERKTDFIMVARAFGARAEKAENAQDFERLFKEATAYSGPYLIEVPVCRDEMVLPMPVSKSKNETENTENEA